MSLKWCIFFLVGMGTNVDLRLLSAGGIADELLEIMGVLIEGVMVRYDGELTLCFDLLCCFV